MTKNERRLVWIFVLTSLLATFALSIFSSMLRIQSAKKSETALATAIAKMGGGESDQAYLQRRIDALERRLADNTGMDEKPAITEFGTSMKALLAKWALVPGRYQLSPSEDGEYIEFAVSGSMLAFLSFLQEAETRGASLASLTFRTVPVGDNADFVFRIRYGE